MNDDEKTELLATKLMGWHRPPGEKSISLWTPDYVRAWYDDKGFRIRGWQPFQRIEYAKMVQGAMIGRGYGMNIHWQVFERKYKVVFIDARAITRGLAVTESRAICEVAGLALGLWEEGDDD